VSGRYCDGGTHSCGAQKALGCTVKIEKRIIFNAEWSLEVEENQPTQQFWHIREAFTLRRPTVQSWFGAYCSCVDTTSLCSNPHPVRATPMKNLYYSMRKLRSSLNLPLTPRCANTAFLKREEQQYIGEATLVYSLSPWLLSRFYHHRS